MKALLQYCCLLVLSIGFSTEAYSQVAVTGPTCVVAGTVYQYTISGSWDSLSTMQMCLTAGVIADSAGTNTCTDTSAPLATILVIWNDSASNGGTISLTSSIGNASLNVIFAQPLLTGSIDSSSKTQTVSIDSIPAPITCSIDTGGSCNPAYQYQWQQSADMVSWTDIPGADSLNLSFSAPLAQSSFFRRKVTETVSGTIGYSDAAAVNVVIAVGFWLREVDNTVTAVLYKTRVGGTGIVNHLPKHFKQYI